MDLSESLGFSSPYIGPGHRYGIFTPKQVLITVRLHLKFNSLITSVNRKSVPTV